jgi:hypothetical protein
MYTKRECAEMILRTQDSGSICDKLYDHFVTVMCQHGTDEFIKHFQKGTSLMLEYIGGGLFRIVY